MRELIVDSFAGGGGASTGILQALGRGPDIAINHDAQALALHRMNHPETLHLPHNVWKVDPVAVTRGRPVGLLWASPDCKHFSKAKGGKPVRREIRDLAWVVVRWARQVRPRVIILENVEEFRDWGPLTADGQPCKDRKGQTFKAWAGELKRLGYRVEHRELRACDYGAPTIRKRLFLIARRDGEKIVWPAPTHGRPDDPDVIAGRKEPWRTAAGIIDWSLPCHSIFLTREEGRAVGVNRPLAEATMARIARGVKRYVIDAAQPSVVCTDMASAAARNGVHGVDEPVRTLTTPMLVGCGGRAGQSRPRGADEPTATGTAKADVCLVAPVMTYAQQGGLNRPAGEPHSTICASAKDQNAVIAAFLSRQFGASVGSDAAEPVGTVTAGGGGKTALVSAFLAQHNTGMVGHHPEEPVSTIVGKGCTQAVVETSFLSHAYTSNTRGGEGDLGKPIKTQTTALHAAHVRAFLTKYYGPAVGQDAQDPLHTATAKPRFGLVTVEIGGEPYVIADIGMRMLSPRELYRAQGFPDSYVIDRGISVEPREGFEDGAGETVIPITKTAQVRMCGNSVCPPLAQALVAANYRERAEARETPAAPGPLFLLEAAE